MVMPFDSVDRSVVLQGLPFLYHQIKDSINIQQTCNLIFSLCRWNERMAVTVRQILTVGSCAPFALFQSVLFLV